MKLAPSLCCTSHFNFSEELQTCKLNLNVIHKSCPLYLSLPCGRIAPGYSGSSMFSFELDNQHRKRWCLFHCASRGKARSRKGTDMKDMTIGGMHPPGDEQTIPRIDGKFLQHCGAAGQGSLPCSHAHMAHSYNYGCHRHPEETSNPAGRRFQTFRGVNLPRMTPLYVLGRRQVGSRRVPVAALQLHACRN